MSIGFPPRAGRRVLLACVVAVVAVGVGACGSSSSSSSTDSTASGSGASSSSSNATYQARLNLARCYRAQGINVPDPSPSTGHAGGEAMQRTVNQYPQAKVQAARQACRQYIAKANPQLNANAATQATFRQQFVKFAKCMRANGVPSFPDRMQDVEARFQTRSIDPNSPAFQSALQACRSYATAIQQAMGH